MARFQSVAAGSYPEYAQAGSGGATFPPFPVVNDTAGQTNPNHRLQFGDLIVDKFGNVYAYVRAAIALAAGQVVRYSIPGDSSSDHPAAGTISANTTTRRIFTNITTTLDERSIGSFLGSPGTSGGTGTPFFKRIKGQVAIGANTTFDISKLQIFHGIGKYDGDELGGTPATSDGVAVLRPYNVVVCGAAAVTEAAPVGVALGTVSQAAGTLILSQGYGQVLGVGNKASTDAIVAGGPLVASTSGTVCGNLTTESAASDMVEPLAIVGRALMAWDSTSHLIPAMIQCQQNL